MTKPKLPPLVEAVRNTIYDQCVRMNQAGVVGSSITVQAMATIAPLLEAAEKMRGNFRLADSDKEPWNYHQEPPGKEVVGDFKRYDTIRERLIEKFA